MSVEAQTKKITVKDFRADLHNDWCPGCGDFGILAAMQMAFAQLAIDPDKLAVFSGIGCSGKTPHYINAYGFPTLHGRVLPVATGGRLANTNLTVVALGGDGDGYGIGAGYFVNSGRRNVNFTYVVHTNQVYGLTNGQAAPTLAKGRRTKSMPEKAIQDGINPIAMAVAAGYTFIARAYALDVKYTASIIARAIQHELSMSAIPLERPMTTSPAAPTRVGPRRSSARPAGSCMTVKTASTIIVRKPIDGTETR